MTATTTQNKRKLTKKEAKEVTVFKQALKYLNSPYWGGKPCSEIVLGCPNCQMEILKSLIEEHIALIEY